MLILTNARIQKIHSFQKKKKKQSKKKRRKERNKERRTNPNTSTPPNSMELTNQPHFVVLVKFTPFQKQKTNPCSFPD